MNAHPTFPMDLTQQVIARVAERYNVPSAALTGAGKSRCLSMARQEAYFEVKRARQHLSLLQIGVLFGQRDRTTILHGIRQHEARMAWVEFIVWAGSDEYQPDLFRRAA